MNTYTEKNMPVRALNNQEYDEQDSSPQYDWDDASYNDDEDLEQDVDDYESSDGCSNDLSETRSNDLSDDSSTQYLPSDYTPNPKYNHLFSLTYTSSESIPIEIVRAHSSWEEALAAYRALKEEQKKNDDMSEFVEFNKKTEYLANKEVDRLFMEALPTMSKAYKERLMKEKEAKKARASDQFYNIGRPSATSHTAWGHKTGGKNKGLSMKDAGSEKVALEIAALRRARRAASKIKKDAEELERAEKFKEMEERKLAIIAEEKSKTPEVQPVMLTEQQLEIKKFEEETLKSVIKKQLEVFQKEEKSKEPTPVSEDDESDDDEYLYSIVKKPTKAPKFTTIQVTKPIAKPVVPVCKQVVPVETKAVCKFFSSGQVCRHGDKCRFSHSMPKAATQILVKNGKKTTIPLDLQFCVRAPEPSRFAWSKPLKFTPVLTPSVTPTAPPPMPPTPVVIAPITPEPVTPTPTVVAKDDQTRSEALNVLASSDQIREKLSFTKMCLSVASGKPCRHGTNCRFAHNKKELKIAPCFFGDKCRFVCMRNGKYANVKDKNCTNLHPGETEDDFHCRTQQKSVVCVPIRNKM
jgi:hypothetical protein